MPRESLGGEKNESRRLDTYRTEGQTAGQRDRQRQQNRDRQRQQDRDRQREQDLV